MKLSPTRKFVWTVTLILSFAIRGLVAETPASATVIAFDEGDTLFVADSEAGKIHAYDMPSGDFGVSESMPYNILNLEEKIVEVLDLEPGSFLQVHDLAVHPISKEAFLSLSGGEVGSLKPAIVRVDQGGKMSMVEMATAEGTSHHLGESADPGVSFWREIPAASLTVTDLDYGDGKLYVSGLGQGEFASTLRVIPFPFSGEESASTIEMYHTAHSQNETRAPVRALTLAEVGGSPTLIAAYTCTPLVTIPVSELQDGAHVTGKTIAELGYGNTPIEVLSFAAMNMKREQESFVLVFSRNMGARLFSYADIAKAESITQGAAEMGTAIGIPSKTIPLSGVIQAADQDPQFILTVRRVLETGALELVSFRKGSYMRISDFISEYNFPDYEYGEGQMQNFVRQFQNALKQ
ncbi:MAG: hypothetical protein AAF191_11960, partial [Verrucomicrobiota bacterium]